MSVHINESSSPTIPEQKIIKRRDIYEKWSSIYNSKSRVVCPRPLQHDMIGIISLILPQYFSKQHLHHITASLNQNRNKKMFTRCVINWVGWIGLMFCWMDAMRMCCCRSYCREVDVWISFGWLIVTVGGSRYHSNPLLHIWRSVIVAFFPLLLISFVCSYLCFNYPQMLWCSGDTILWFRF